MTTTTQLTIFEQGQLPAHLADLNQQGNIEIRSTVNQLSFRGKTFRVIVDGKEEAVTNKEGDPVPAVKVVILDYNKQRSRAYYPAYEEGKSQPPICWSNDSIAPDKSVPAERKQARTCAECKQSQKGSKITDAGKAVMACSPFRRAVLVPVQDVNFPPLLLKIPQTSMWDGDNKENEQRGFYAFDQYMEMIKRKGCNHTALVVTKIKFDARTAYPKLVFSADDWTPATATASITAQLAKKELIESMLTSMDIGTPAVGGGEAPAPEEFEQVAPAAAAEAAAVVAKAAAPAPAPAPAPAAAAAPAAPAAPKAPPKGRPAAVKPAAAAPAPVAEPAVIEGEATVEAEPAVAAASASAGLGSLLGSWDD